jgi:predicted branched-subunit amino acid permease
MGDDRLTFQGFRAGAIECFPAVIASTVFGFAVGLFAAQRGLPAPVEILMNMLVCAGTAEFATMALWQPPLPWAAIFLAVLAINSRFLLMGAAMREAFARVPPARAYFSLFFLYDAVWATVMRRHAEGKSDAGFLLGGGITLWLFWQAATYAGYKFGLLVPNPAAWGLDFCMAAFLANLTASLWRQRGDLLPFAVAGLVSVLCHRFVSAELNLVVGALSGSLAALLRRPDVR